MLRVGELVRHALAGLFTRGEIEDDALIGKVITVPEVRMSPDLKLATAYIMPLGGEGAAEVVAALNRHQRFIRGRIAPGEIIALLGLEGAFLLVRTAAGDMGYVTDTTKLSWELS